MTAETQIVNLLGRIAAATSAIRVRGEDHARLERNGGDTAEIRARIAAVVVRLERVATELEDALA